MALQYMESAECLSSPVLAYYTGAVTVTLNSPTGLKAFKKYGLTSQLGLPIFSQGHLAHIVPLSSASLLPCGARIGAIDCLQIFSVTFLFLNAFQLPYPSFVIPDALLLLFSEYSLPFVTLTLLIHRVRQEFLFYYYYHFYINSHVYTLFGPPPPQQSPDPLPLLQGRTFSTLLLSDLRKNIRDNKKDRVFVSLR
jgi:hypothetical protein